MRIRHHLNCFNKLGTAVIFSAAVGSLTMPLAQAGAENPQADIFSTPDAQNPPTFAGRNRPAPSNQPPDPLFGPGGDPPGRDAIRAIPSITGPQMKELDDIINHNRDSITPLQQEVASLRRIQDQRKKQGLPGAILGSGIPAAAPDTLHRDGGMGMMSMMEASPDAGSGSGFSDDSDDSIKARMDSLNQQIGEIRAQQWPQIRSMLSPQQISQLQQMRNGRLLIASTSATDVPEPPPDKPAPKPASRTPMMPPILRQAFPGAPPVPMYPPNRPIAYPPAKQPSLVRPLIYTTKQLIYRNLWRLY